MCHLGVDFSAHCHLWVHARPLPHTVPKPNPHWHTPKQNFLAHGIDRRVQGPKSLGPWGLQDNLPCCLSLISVCIVLTPLTRQALSTQGESSCHWPNIPTCIFTAANPRGREGNFTSTWESHEKNPDWSRGHLEPITESRMCTRICP